MRINSPMGDYPVPCRELLIPPRASRYLAGTFTFGKSISLYPAEDSDRLPLRQLSDDLNRLKTVARFTSSQKAAGVRIIRDKHITGDEAYRLTIKPDGIEIASRTAAGAYYAIQTLRDLLKIYGKTLPAMRIDDSPTLARRGVYLDCSRGKVPKVKTIKQLIERLAHWKINELQLYIENVFKFSFDPDIGRGYSPFSADDILTIQQHCNAHHIRLVGSLASFGHMEKILALPKYRHLGELPGYNGHPGGTTLCPSDPGSIKLISQMYEEFLPLFQAEDFNICGDEPWELGKGRSKRQVKKHGLGKVYLNFILKIHKLCQKYNKRMNMWADIVLAHPEIILAVPKDIVMLNWDYYPEGKRMQRTNEIVNAGLSVICCPGTHGWQSHGSRMKHAINNVARFSRIARKYAAEGLLNTDWGDFGHRNTLGVSLHGLAHGAACAWCGTKVDHKHFTERFCQHLFNDKKGKLATALRILGADEGYHLYHALVEPFDLTKPMPLGSPLGYEPRVIDDQRITTKDLHNRYEMLKALHIPRVSVADEFEAVALEEFRLAREMDLLACKRMIIGRDIRAGRRVSATVLRCLNEQMREMMNEFARLWLARNRPSRLRDNLTAMNQVISETEAMMGKI